MLYNKKTFLLLIIFLVIFSGTVCSNDDFINLNFKGVDLRDALRTIAEYAEVNLIADESVKGQITINLKNLSFQNALKLISESSGLGWEYKNNTYFVAKESRINDLFSEFTFKKINIKNRNANEIKLILKEIYPDIQTSVDIKNNDLFLRGEVKKLREVEKTILVMDKKSFVNNEEISFEFIEIKTGSFEEIIKTINLLYPKIETIILDEINKILIYGNQKDNQNVKQIINNHFQNKKIPNSYKYSLILNKTLYDRIENLISKYKEELIIFYEEKNEILYLEGEKENVDFLLNLINKIKEERKPNIVIENVKLNYISIEYVENLAQKIFPEINFHSNFQRSLITVKGSENKVEELFSILEKIDKPKKQIMIEAKILEVSFRDLKELGVNPGDLSRIRILEKKDSIVSLEWPELFKLLKENGSAKVLASPTLLTVEGKKAELLIGDKIPMKTTNDGEEEIKYIEAGINLNFLPLLTSENEIILDINPKVSSLGETIGGSLPSINTREVNTTVRLNNKETFIIAGLIQEDIIKTKKAIPILEDIPLLGNIFKSYEESNRQNEVIIMLKPYIIDDYNKEKDNSSQEEGKFRLNIEEYNVWKEKMDKIKI
ncbi:MAG: type II secretion system protein GspD [Bacillota bacterium]